jgi:hypothetical protein
VPFAGPSGYLSVIKHARDGIDGYKASFSKFGNYRSQLLSSRVRGMLLCLATVDPGALAPREQPQALQHAHYGGDMPSAAPCSRYRSSVQLIHQRATRDKAGRSKLLNDRGKRSGVQFRAPLDDL